MRIRSVLVAGALVAAGVLGGAVSASACDGDTGASGAGGYSHEGAGFYYHNLGGPAGITDAGGAKYERQGWFGFTGF